MALTGDVGLTLGAQAELTLLSPKGGRHVNWTTVVSNQGYVMTTIAVSISHGLMMGISLEGTLIRPNATVNNSFYHKAYTPMQILFDVDEEELFPSLQHKTIHNVTNHEESDDGTLRKLLRKVYIQLEQLRRGDSWEPPFSTPSEENIMLNESAK
jgi:hypothetical protein